MSYFHEKVALVTGGASGIGFAIVQNLLENGIKGVAVIDISEKDGNKIGNILKEYHNKIIFIKADVTKESELEDAFEKTISKFKNIDMVFNNAGIVNEVEWEKIIDVNLEAVIRGTYLAKNKYLPKYKSGNEGVIINTCSLLGHFGMSHLPVYCAAKHGLIGFAKSLAADKYFAFQKIKLITLCPGVIDTPLQGDRSIVVDKAACLHDLYQLSEKISSPQFVGESVIKIIQEGKHGSVWMIENEEPAYEVQFPDKAELRKKY